jgi:hypothetical protein
MRSIFGDISAVIVQEAAEMCRWTLAIHRQGKELSGCWSCGFGLGLLGLPRGCARGELFVGVKAAGAVELAGS